MKDLRAALGVVVAVLTQLGLGETDGLGEDVVAEAPIREPGLVAVVLAHAVEVVHHQGFGGGGLLKMVRA